MEMIMKFTNTTSQTKAVKVAGSFEVLTPKQSKDIEGDFSEAYLERLKDSGVTSEVSKGGEDNKIDGETEREAVFAEAKLLGIKVAKNMKTETVQAKIAAGKQPVKNILIKDEEE